MPWSAPRTWVADELVDAPMLNEQIRDNLVALKDPPTHVIVRDNGGYYSTTSTTLVPVDSTNLKLTLDTNGGAVMVGLTACVTADSSTNRYMTLDIRVDGAGAWATDQGFDGGIATVTILTAYYSQIFFFGPVLLTGLSAGQHTFELMWKVNTGTGYMRASTSSSQYIYEVPIIFWAREVS